MKHARYETWLLEKAEKYYHRLNEGQMGIILITSDPARSFAAILSKNFFIELKFLTQRFVPCEL